MKRVFGKVEVIFDTLYLLVATLIGFYLFVSSAGNTIRLLAGVMALVLALGDAFHLIPRIFVITTGEEEIFRFRLGRGKQITSITMTIFYILLWEVGNRLFNPFDIELWTMYLYLLAFIRIGLCLLPQNKWVDRYPPLSWGVYRNVPFFLMGMIVTIMFYKYRSFAPAFRMAWFAISLSFAFYLPVVFYANKHPKIGMLMLPKTIMYIWLLVMCLSI